MCKDLLLNHVVSVEILREGVEDVGDVIVVEDEPDTLGPHVPGRGIESPIHNSLLGSLGHISGVSAGRRDVRHGEGHRVTTLGETAMSIKTGLP